ncbi:MAG: hypothetical protein U9532_00015 ['Conium maculatum' witches'-broom phytoplasma]|nr:hypothetical protein ['Conium maculatum' witches'-broom phytoplasma]
MRQKIKNKKSGKFSLKAKVKQEKSDKGRELTLETNKLEKEKASCKWQIDDIEQEIRQLDNDVTFAK